MLRLSNRTGRSDLRIILWVEILSAVLVQEVKAKEVGSDFYDEDCYVYSQSFINVELQNVLTDIYIEQPHIIDK